MSEPTPGLPVNVVHTAELMNRWACPTMSVTSEVLYDKHGAKHTQEENIALHDNCFVCKKNKRIWCKDWLNRRDVYGSHITILQ